MPAHFDVILELAIIERIALARVLAKIAERQEGQAFIEVENELKIPLQQFPVY